MILLHTTKYGDSSIILHVYTREGGRESFMLRGMGKKGGKRGGGYGYLHPLSVLSAEISPNYHPGASASSMRYIKEISSKYPLHSLRSNVYKNSIALYMSELLYKTLLISQQDIPLYDFIEKSILSFDAMESDFSNFHVWFTVKYVAWMGFFPSDGFSLEFNPFLPSEITFLKNLSSASFEEAMTFSMNGDQRTKFINGLIRYLEYHLGTVIDIKSLSVLHSVFR